MENDKIEVTKGGTGATTAQDISAQTHEGEIVEEGEEVSFDPADFVPLRYQMNIDEEVLVGGWRLQDGMEVLVEDILFRKDPENLKKELSAYEFKGIMETARFCTVAEYHTMNHNFDIMSFIGVYKGGEQISRTYNKEIYWIVKRSSLPEGFQLVEVKGR